jgi:hypothetical protein
VAGVTASAPETPAAAAPLDDTQARLRAIAEREQAEHDTTDASEAAEAESARAFAENTPDEFTPPTTPAASGGQIEPDAQPASVDDDGIEAPAEKKDAKGRVTHRRYLILKPDGSGKYSEISWHVDKDGRMVAAGTKGAKKQKHALARGQEDALKIGYAAVGAPPRVTLIAVAESQFQPKTVEPEAPRPERARLKIR